MDRKKIFEAWRKKPKPVWPVRFDINVCPARIQTFVNNNIAHIQFYKIGKAARIEIFAEGGTLHSAALRLSRPAQGPTGRNSPARS